MFRLTVIKEMNGKSMRKTIPDPKVKMSLTTPQDVNISQRIANKAAGTQAEETTFGNN